MYLKYEAIDIDNYNKGLEIAMFEGIAYDYYYGCCRISFIGDFADILQPMTESEYSEFVYTMTAALFEKRPLLELCGKWILDFEDNYKEDEWEEMFKKAKNIIY